MIRIPPQIERDRSPDAVEGLDLDALEEVARDAANYAPGPWSAQTSVWGGEYGADVEEALPTGKFYCPSGYVDLQSEGPANHIATFDPPAVLRLIATIRETASERDEAQVALAIVRESLVDQGAARADPAMPVLTPAVLEQLRGEAEASYAMAETRDERVYAHGLSLLCDWQDRARTAISHAPSRSEGGA